METTNKTQNSAMENIKAQVDARFTYLICNKTRLEDIRNWRTNSYAYLEAAIKAMRDSGLFDEDEIAEIQEYGDVRIYNVTTAALLEVRNRERDAWKF